MDEASGRKPATRDAAESWYDLPRALFTGGNQVRLLGGGDELFPAMEQAIAQAQREIWLATYIFFDDDAARRIADALAAAAQRGVQVHVVVDGFGSKSTLATLARWWLGSGVRWVVFRPLDRWWAFLQPGQLRRLHQKLCVVDGEVAFVGGINIIDDRNDLNHGRGEAARLDFAVALRGPVVRPIEQSARAVWTRADLGHDWREEVLALARSAEPLEGLRGLLRALRIRSRQRELIDQGRDDGPVYVAFVVRDNLRQRRAIERSYIDAVRWARQRVDIVSPYFYPGGRFRRALRDAARRGVHVRLLLQGKIDYRFAGLAARVLYDEMIADGVQIYEYMPAFLHAKVALVDQDWATVGSSNIDPLSLLLNLEANVIVRDARFCAELSQRFDAAVAASQAVTAPALPAGWSGALKRGFVAGCAHWYLRLAGISGRY